ncbi:hypothetical protein BGZ46_006974 [Entomortierella lignicola]|nr:hypothetical protein BGZ46_006974 [Entomortierella lignicola]
MTLKPPLFLPEIVSHIAVYLRQRDIARCLIVCKDWHEQFLPLLWSRVSIRDPLPSNIQAYSHLVTALTFETFPESFCIQYPNLRIVKFRYESSIHGESNSECDPAILITLNPSIYKLEIMQANRVLHSSLLESIPRLLNLEKLVVSQSMIPTSELVGAFWRACKNVKSLKLIGVDFVNHIGFPEDMECFNARKLKIMSNGSDENIQLDLISRCPQLKKLEWKTYQGREFVGTIVERFISGTWPNLEKFSANLQLKDNEAEKILNGIKRATRLEFTSGLGPRASVALERHFKCLIDISLVNDTNVESTVFRDILCSCPQLKSLTGDRVFARDIVAGGSWACLSLKILRIRIEFEETEYEDTELQSQVFEKISPLVRLEELYLSKSSVHQFNERPGLHFRLDCGMGHLSNLKMLRHLSIPNTRQVLEKEDVIWITENWTRLKHISGCLHTHSDINAEFRRILQTKLITGCI